MSNNDKYEGKWVLLNKKHEVIYYNDDMIKVIEKGGKYPKGDVVIDKKMAQGTCFF